MKYFLILLMVALLGVSCSREVPEELIDSRDGRVYRTVKIGDQIWMAENLAYMPFVSELDSDSGIWVFGYNGTSTNWAKTLEVYKDFGCLYNWTTAMDISSEYNSTWWAGQDSLHQGICPDGWHLPSQSEWQLLENIVDTNPDFTTEDERQNTGSAGLLLKSDSVWAASMEGTNKYNFNILPGGMRYHTGFYLNRFTYGYFWTSTEKYPGSAVYRYVRDSSDATFKGNPSKLLGLSVRCLKD